MNNERRSVAEERGMGVGYVTLIMLFAVICLTVLASLSYQAARANDMLNEKSVDFTGRYYAADGKANEFLAVLDEAAFEAHETGFFADSFESFCEEKKQSGDMYPEDAVIKRVREGFSVSYSCSVTDNLDISVELLFFDVPYYGMRYCVEEWKTVTVSADETEEILGVWDGTIPG